MRGTWLPFLFVVQVGVHSSRTARSRTEPSCEELRQFWHAVRETGDASLLTNEIPLIPWYALDPDYGRVEDRRQQKSEQILSRTRLQNTHGTILSDAHHAGSSRPGPVLSGFAEVAPPYPVSGNPLSGTEKKSPGDFFFESGGWGPATVREEEDGFQGWGLPGDVGQFGRFVDFDDGVPLMSRDGGQPVAEWATPRISAAQESCLQTIKKFCISDQQCSCAGWNMRCHRGKCSQHHLHNEMPEREMWHEGPMSSSKLGMFKNIRKRSHKSILM